MAGERIAVLGAGPMGLAVAWQLVQDGHHPVIFEADDRVGGMSASFDFGGLKLERYYHFICTTDDCMMQTLDELQLKNKLRWAEAKMGYYYAGSLHAWGNPVALLKFPHLSLLAKLRYGMHAFITTKRTRWKRLDTLDAITWIKRWVGKEAYDVLWHALFDYKFYDYKYDISAAWIWSRIRRIGRSRYDLFREKLGYLEGGSETLLNALKDAIEIKGGEIRLSCPVKRVVMENGKVRGVETANNLEAFDKVISTVPLPLLPALMPDLPVNVLGAFRAIKNVSVVCVIVKLRRPFTGVFWLNINDPGMDTPGMIEYSNLRPLGHCHVVYAPFYLPSHHPKYKEPDEAFISRVKRYMMTINPSLTEDDILDIRASRCRYAQPVCDPGFAGKLPPVALPVKGLFAADTSYYYPHDRGMSESIEFGRQMARMATGA